jgi:hypothetical protein
MERNHLRRASVVCGLVAFALLCGQLAFAAATTPEQAKAVVTGWLKGNNAPLGTPLGAAIQAVTPYKDDAGAAIYYVVTLQPSGFVVVSADDLIEPIIAFAGAGKYDPATTNPLGALVSQDQKARIAVAKAQAARAGGAVGRAASADEARTKWQLLVAHAGTETVSARGIADVSDVRVGQLLTTKWSQSYAAGAPCYNIFTPRSPDYPCGCVATAMAQLMRYHQWPTEGIGRGPAYFYMDGENTLYGPWPLLGGDNVGGPYMWADMPENPEMGISDEQRRAIGRLCHDAGMAAHMNYGMPTQNGPASGAWMWDAGIALRKPFKYGNVVIGGREKPWSTGRFTIDLRFYNMVNSNLDAGCPVLFAIEAPGSAHAIVCDGYGFSYATQYHHLNMGWSGYGDVWYELPSVLEYSAVTSCIYNVFTSGTGGELVTGRVTTTGGGTPIAQASVTLSGASGSISATTNANGIYAFRVASSATYTVTASKPGLSFTHRIITTGTSADYQWESGNRWGVNLLGSDAPPPPPSISSIVPSTGPLLGGTTVTITGTNFTGATSVTFGTVDATAFTVNSATQITATTPPQGTPGAVIVLVTVPGVTASLASGFTYTISASQPTISNISPASGPTTGGTTVTITGTNYATAGTTSVLFGDTAATAVTASSVTSLTCTAPAHSAGVVDVKVMNPDGQSVIAPMSFTYRDAVALTKDVAVSGDTSSGGIFYYYFDVPAGVTQVSIMTTTSVAGDILDLGVNGPVTGTYPEDWFSADLCSLGYSGNEAVVFNYAVQPGRYCIVVARPAFGTGGAYSIVASYVVGGSVPAPTVTFIRSDNGVSFGGSYVRVYGQNFATTGSVTVTFGGNAATEVYVAGSGRVIYCTTPAHATALVDVAVTNPDGQSATLYDGFEYLTAYKLWNGYSYQAILFSMFNTATSDVPCYFIAPAGVRSVTISTSNTSGDILDLTVNKPETGVWPGSPYSGDKSCGTASGDETVTFVGDDAQKGVYYILVGRYGNGGPFDITARAEMPGTLAAKRKFQLNFKTKLDSLDITFQHDLLKEIDKATFVAATDVEMFIGSLSWDTATLQKGRGTGLAKFGKFTWNAKKGEMKYAVRKTVLQTILDNYGALNMTMTTNISVPIVLLFKGSYYGDYYSFAYTAVKDKTGKGK